MAVKAIFRSALFAVTNDDPTSLGASTDVLSESAGMATPAADFNQNAGQQRLDTTAQEVASPTIDSGDTYAVSLASIAGASRAIIRVIAQTDFTVAYTPNGGLSRSLALVGSPYQPGIFEATVEDLSSLSVTNDGDAAAAFVIAVANVVDYDDSAVGGDFAPLPTPATGSNVDLGAGLLPIGAIIPVAGTFTASGNGGTYSEAAILPLPSWLKYCDGTIIADVNSVLNGRYVPDLSDDRFIMGAGSTAAGSIPTLGNTRDLRHTHVSGTTGTASVNTTTRTTSVAASITQPTFTVDAHRHNIAHVHAFARTYGDSIYSFDTAATTHNVPDSGASNAWAFIAGDINRATSAGSTNYLIPGTPTASRWYSYTGGPLAGPSGTLDSALSGTANVATTTRSQDVALSFTQPTFTVDDHTHSFTTPAATWTNATVQADPSVVDIRPKWLAFKYYMRIK